MFKILMISLGCDKNLCDSEEMLGRLQARGYDITNDEADADAVIINTCSFIKDAMQESIDNILEMAQLKGNAGIKYIIVCGCLAERFKDEITKEIPEIDAVVGTTGFDKIVDVIDKLREGEKNVTSFEPLDYLTDTRTDRVLTASTFYSYLKIAEGCDKRCTYCAIPKFRGPFRSVPMEKLLEQARMLASNGIKELMLVAQETTCYGKDIYGEKKLHTLIRKLSEIEGIEWIRLLYAYPEEIYDELIEEMATNKKVCHYIDMPLQHTEDKILKRMGRRINKEGIVNVVSRLRERMPDICIRTTFIAGFPGEEASDHEALMEFINELEFDRLGVFTYSREEGTPAAEFPNQVDEEIAADYMKEIMELQQEISFEKNEALVGETLAVIIEGYIAEDDVYVGRTYRDAPNVDGLVFVTAPYELMSGAIVEVKINEASEYDLIGDVVE